ncbi:hypothetical protein D9758_004679 [Tetrapyrgos nigripes]|uniref:Mid2 domain-containing protein n=1 Tax=Tetrapyrgos nigripes TaxID=182062 RepID=A0A8H5LYR9_9AGAR|nr:hypothetical protein D9758_004679 [Tetrapyrgos nigripes]
MLKPGTLSLRLGCIHILAFLVYFCLTLSTALAGNTTCVDSGLDWYYNLVGESPCVTYERIRQICNPNYEVPTFSLVAPPDVCNDQVHDCCCNEIAFMLSMFCLNCQQGFSKSSSGYDAPKGTYQSYLKGGGDSFCSPNSNDSFPTKVQTAVCNKQIRVLNGLYGTRWSEGDWYYVYTLEYISEKAATDGPGKEMFSNGNCNDTTSNNTTSESSLPASSTGTPSDTSNTTTSTSLSSSNGDDISKSASLARGAIAGISIGAVILVGLIGVLWWLVRKERRQRKVYQYHDSTAQSGGYGHWLINPFVVDRDMAERPHAIEGSSAVTQSSSTDAKRLRAGVVTPPTPTSRGGRKNIPAAETLRHTDGGPVPVSPSPSGRLPPAYGEQVS